MDYLIGIVLATAVGALATLVGFDRDRAFYPTVMIVIASYYVLFAVTGGSTQALTMQAAVMALFAGVAIAGFKRSLWLVVAALAGHALFDALQPAAPSAGVPPWWPHFCLGYDAAAAAYLAWRLTRARTCQPG